MSGADTVVTVAIAPADRERATLFYRFPFPGGQRALGFRLDEGQAVVPFESCPPNRRRFSGRGVVGRRTQFNGGFLFTEPQYLRLTRREGRRAATSSPMVAHAVIVTVRCSDGAPAKSNHREPQNRDR
jgi:hypothetical protein